MDDGTGFDATPEHPHGQVRDLEHLCELALGGELMLDEAEVLRDRLIADGWMTVGGGWLCEVPVDVWASHVGAAVDQATVARARAAQNDEIVGLMATLKGVNVPGYAVSLAVLMAGNEGVDTLCTTGATARHVASGGMPAHVLADALTAAATTLPLDQAAEHVGVELGDAVAALARAIVGQRDVLGLEDDR